MKKIISFLFIVLLTPAVWAAPPSIIGGKDLGVRTAHVVGAGWPSLFYEWWHGGRTNWALGAEIVYGDWLGEFSDVDIGLGLNVPLRWHMARRGIADVGFKFTPGILLANAEGSPPGNDFVFGIRGDFGVPISIELDPKVSLVTGVSLPMGVLFQDGNNEFVIPIMPRIGVEVMPIHNLTIFFLVELGPTIGVSSGNSDVKLGVRGFFGTSFF